MYFELEPVPVWTRMKKEMQRVELIFTSIWIQNQVIICHKFWFILSNQKVRIVFVGCYVGAVIFCNKLGCIFNVTRWMWQLWYLWIHCRTEQQLMGNAFIQIVAKTCWLCPPRRTDRLHTNTHKNIRLSPACAHSFRFVLFAPISPLSISSFVSWSVSL